MRQSRGKKEYSLLRCVINSVPKPSSISEDTSLRKEKHCRADSLLISCTWEIMGVSFAWKNSRRRSRIKNAWVHLKYIVLQRPPALNCWQTAETTQTRNLHKLETELGYWPEVLQFPKCVSGCGPSVYSWESVTSHCCLSADLSLSHQVKQTKWADFPSIKPDSPNLVITQLWGGAS